MTTRTVDHKTLKHLIDTGPVQATAVADGDKWALVFKIRLVDMTLISVNSRKVKIFKKLDTIAKYLQTLGLTHFDTDARNFDSTQKSDRRPDKAIVLKAAHKAAAYDEWFKAEVQLSLDDIKNGTDAPQDHNDFFAEFDEETEKLAGQNKR